MTKIIDKYDIKKCKLIIMFDENGFTNNDFDEDFSNEILDY